MLEPKNCVVCKTLFIPRHKKQICCSRRCLTKRSVLKSKSYRALEHRGRHIKRRWTKESLRQHTIIVDEEE